MLTCWIMLPAAGDRPRAATLEPRGVAHDVAARPRHVLVPARTAAGRVARGVEAQAGDHREGVAAVGVHGDPRPATGRAEALEAARVLGLVQEAAAVQRVAHRARAV